MHESIIIALGGVVILSFICQWLAWRIKLPAILLLLITGLFVGPMFHLVNPQQLFGNLLIPMVELAVAIILFEGSLNLNIKEVKKQTHVVSNLLTMGVFVTIILTAVLVHFLFHLPVGVSLLTGVIACVSGPTVVMPLLHIVKPGKKLSSILHWESIIIDPIGAMLAVLMFSFILVHNAKGSVEQVILEFTWHMLFATVVGLGVGYFCGVALRCRWIPKFLRNVFVLAMVLFTYMATNHFDSGAGLLSVTLMGLILANMDDVKICDILNFKESLSILLISGLFIVLAANISFDNISQLIIPAVILVTALQFIVRPASVFLCSLNSGLNWREKVLLAWIHPRGIVAAAVSALFAIRLRQHGIAGYHQLVPIIFLVIIGTVVFQSLTTSLLAKCLKLRQR